MTDKDTLLHDYLDGELDETRRADFEQRCLEESSTHEALAEMRGLRNALGELPRPNDPGPRLRAAIMREVLATANQPQPAPVRRNLWAWILQPLAVPAWGVAVALLTCGAALYLALAPRLAPPAVPAVAPLASAPAAPTAAAYQVDAVDCAQPEAVPVRFFLRAPDARSVSLVGDFNHWQAAAESTARDANGNGIWTVTLYLKPGRYQYKFVVDGQWVDDPEAQGYVPDGFGSRNSLLSI